MTGAAWAWMTVAAAFAVGDWLAVARKPATGTAVTGKANALEYVCKPATLAALVGAALALDPADGAVRGWFVVALVLSLAGDVFLMLPRDLFVPGLASFLGGHIAYIVGLWIDGVDAPVFGVGVALVAVLLVIVGRPIVNGVRSGREPELAPPVVAYMLVISAMVASAIGTGSAWAIVGALLFYASDAHIAWNRFLRPTPHGPLVIIVTYHLGQAALVYSLA